MGFGWSEDESAVLPLKNKNAMFVITAGAGTDFYSHLGEFTSIEGMLYPLTYSLHGAGMIVKHTFPVYDAPLNDEKLNAVAEKVEKAVLGINEREALPFDKKTEGKDEIEVFASIPDLS